MENEKLNIAICDDDQGVCFQLEDWLLDYQKEKKVRWNIEVYYRTEQLFEEMERETFFDVIFLDIEFPGKTGVELAKQIRGHLENQDTRIVFISGETKYCPELFELETLNFHQKPLSEEAIRKDLERIIKYKKGCLKSVVYMEDGVQRRMPLHKIMYFMSEKRKVFAVLENGERIEMREKLRELQEKNERNSFCRTHRFYLVNLSYVTRYLKGYLLLKNGEEIPISDDQASNVRTAWGNYERE